MSDVLKAIGVFVGAIVGVFILIFALNAFGLFNFGFFGPRYEAVRRNIWEQSQARHEGAIRDLADLQIKWREAKTDGERSAIRTAVEAEASFPKDELPPELRIFVEEVEQ